MSCPGWNRRRQPDKRAEDKLVAGARPGWQYMLDRLAAGPTLSGHVQAARDGTPLEATVSVDEIKTFENESHTSHPVTGRFDRVLPREGTYHVRIEKDGYLSRVVEVEVGREWKTIVVELEQEERAAQER